MQTLTAPQGYRPGGTWGICDRCSFKLRLAQLRTEWTGFKVCDECWDSQPADLRAPNIYPEGLPVRDPRPEQPVPIPEVPVVPIVDNGDLDLGDTSDGGRLYWMGLL